MQTLALKKDQIERLEFQSNQAYSALIRGISIMNSKDAVWANALYEKIWISLSDVALELQYLPPSNQRSFMYWERGNEKTDLIDRYVLDYIVGNKVSNELINVSSWKARGFQKENHNPSSEYAYYLKKTIDEKEATYDWISLVALKAVKEENFFKVFNILNYIRETYKTPTV
jgi:hypothetical protein